MAGQDWHKEVGTWKGADKPGGVDYSKRMEFYMDRSKFKLSQNFNDVVNDLTAKGFKTMDDLKPVGMPLRKIKAGDTLFPILKGFFLEKFKDKGMTADQAGKEAYLSLAFVMKNNAGINVDDLKVGGEITIDGGYLSVIAPDNKYTINRVPLRPVAVSAEPEPDPAPSEGKMEGPKVEPEEVPAPAPVEGGSKNEGPVAPAPVEGGSKNEGPVAPALVEGGSKTEGPKVEPAPAPEKTEGGKEVRTGSYGEIQEGTFDKDNGKIIEGKVTFPSGKIEEGTFDKDTGYLIGGKKTLLGGEIQEGTFDKDTTYLIDGKHTRPDGRVIEGTFDKDSGHLIEGTVTIGEKVFRYKNGKSVMADGTTPAPVGSRSKNEGPVAPVPVEGGSKNEGPVAPAPEKTEGTKKIINPATDIIYEGTFNADETKILEGKVTRPDGVIFQGKFDKNTSGLIEGKETWPDGEIQEGKFDKDNGRLIEGKHTRPDGTIREGTFDKDSGHLIEGTVTIGEKVFTYKNGKSVMADGTTPAPEAVSKGEGPSDALPTPAPVEAQPDVDDVFTPEGIIDPAKLGEKAKSFGLQYKETGVNHGVLYSEDGMRSIGLYLEYNTWKLGTVDGGSNIWRGGIPLDATLRMVNLVFDIERNTSDLKPIDAYAAQPYGIDGRAVTFHDSKYFSFLDFKQIINAEGVAAVDVAIILSERYKDAHGQGTGTSAPVTVPEN